MQDKLLMVEPSLFPCVYKDVNSGVYFAECKTPLTGALDRIQLVIDNNVMGTLTSSPDLFKRITWALARSAAGQPSIVHIKPFWAYFEQYLSNPDSAQKKIEAFVENEGTMNSLSLNDALSLLAEMREKDEMLREQIGKFACYFFVMKEIYYAKYGLDEKVARWRDFYSHDIPRLRVPYLLGGLFFFGKDDSKMAFKFTDRKVQDWAQAFLSRRKSEIDSPTRWIRNRLFDLMPFQMLPGLNMVSDGGVDSRLFLLTRDSDVGECFLRIFSWFGDQKKNSLWIVQTNFECLHFPEHAKFENTVVHGVDARLVTDEYEKAQRLTNLIDVSLKFLSASGQSELLPVLHELNVLDSPSTAGR
jgi:hypothetical protein